MKQVAISEFKAKCLSLLDEVQKTKKPICITRFGKPIAEVSPPSAKAHGADWFGSMKDEIQILGDHDAGKSSTGSRRRPKIGATRVLAQLACQVDHCGRQR